MNVKKKEKIENCPVRDILDRIGDKWSILIIIALHKRKMRFNKLNREINDISQKMLTVTLRSLEADGIVKRTVYAEVPPKVEYEITMLGNSLVPIIDKLIIWSEENMENIKIARLNNHR